MSHNFYDIWRLSITLCEASIALHDFVTDDMFFLEPNKRNNYLWVFVDVETFSELDIKGVRQQLIALEKGYVE